MKSTNSAIRKISYCYQILPASRNGISRYLVQMLYKKGYYSFNHPLHFYIFCTLEPDPKSLFKKSYFWSYHQYFCNLWKSCTSCQGDLSTFNLWRYFVRIYRVLLYLHALKKACNLKIACLKKFLYHSKSQWIFITIVYSLKYFCHWISVHCIITIKVFITYKIDYFGREIWFHWRFFWIVWI